MISGFVSVATTDVAGHPTVASSPLQRPGVFGRPGPPNERRVMPTNSPVIAKIIDRARSADRQIVLPEATDPRVLTAARRITDEGYARVLLIGQADKLRAAADSAGVALTGIEHLDHLTDPARGEYIDALHQRRKHKGLSPADADKLLKRTVYYGGMMVGAGRVDGMVAGSICPTRDTVRASLFGVGLSEGNRTLSSCSVMNTIVPEVGVHGSLIFADTGVMPEPNADQLADIALAAADACRSLLDVEPYVAMLSFSSKGSGYSPLVQRVIDATRLAKQRRPDINLDGELQVDSALIPDIARRKAKDSPVAGRANTLVFPDLACGNIGYKLVERLGRATALGPLLTGLKRPVNDLSRGCSVEDIVLISAITSVQAEQGSAVDCEEASR